MKASPCLTQVIYVRGDRRYIVGRLSANGVKKRTTMTPKRFRLLIQSLFVLACAYVGWRFLAFYQWVTGVSNTPAVRPPGVEAFLPISALLGAKQYFLTGIWDKVHPAGLTILLAAVLMSLLFRKAFCGYVCPVGFLSGLLERAGKKLGISRSLPLWAERILGSVKYVLLGFFVYTVWNMDIRAVSAFIRSPYNMVSDAKLLEFFLHPSGTALGVMLALAALSLVLRNFWCRFLCPYGALTGLWALASPLFIRRDRQSCINCGKCRRACPADIRVDKKELVNSTQCLGCMQCAGACPVQGCLTPRVVGFRVPLWLAGAGAVAVFVLAWWWAKSTGHWDSSMPGDMLRVIYARNL